MTARNDGIPHDTEDKGWWCQHGVKLEARFVELCNSKLGLVARVNPDKQQDPFAPDLIVNDVLADLKVQNTPFFVAKRYGLDPRRAVTFNRKDYERYKSLYPQLHVYYWVEWTQTQSKFGSVDYLAGIYRLPFSAIASLIENGAPEHHYMHRRNDRQGNAKSSFLLALDSFEVIFEVA